MSTTTTAIVPVPKAPEAKETSTTTSLPKPAYKNSFSENKDNHLKAGAALRAKITGAIKSGLNRSVEFTKNLVDRAIGAVAVEGQAIIDRNRLNNAAKIQTQRITAVKNTAGIINDSGLTADEKKDLAKELRAAMVSGRSLLNEANSLPGMATPKERQTAEKTALEKVKGACAAIAEKISNLKLDKEVKAAKEEVLASRTGFFELVDNSSLPDNQKEELKDQIRRFVSTEGAKLREKVLGKDVHYENATPQDKLQYNKETLAMNKDFNGKLASEIERRKEKLEIDELVAEQRKIEELAAARESRLAEVAKRRGMSVKQLKKELATA